MNHCPLINSVDLLIVGSSSAAVAAALSAREEGASVCVISPLNYMGEDITAYLRYELLDDESAGPEIAQKIYAAEKRPAVIKHTLEQALIAADVEVIFGSSPIGVLENDNGDINGLVIANRCGRQAIAAKRIIDATEFALCARTASVEMHAWNGGSVEARFRVVSNEALHDGADVLPQTFALPVKDKEVEITSILEYRSSEKMADNSLQSWCALQKKIQSKFWQHNASVYSERAYILPQDSIRAVLHVDGWDNAQMFSLDALRS
ncbi:MAG: FAD-dependent oxidoreductase [Planctomycetes bacterium]|nr:FAD-dependent oxidoreductase [Planctomycetota bacterium]